MIGDFSFTIPQNCVFGVGALKKLPELLNSSGVKNAMLISDRVLEKRFGRTCAEVDT